MDALSTQNIINHLQSAEVAIKILNEIENHLSLQDYDLVGVDYFIHKYEKSYFPLFRSYLDTRVVYDNLSRQYSDTLLKPHDPLPSIVTVREISQYRQRKKEYDLACRTFIKALAHTGKSIRVIHEKLTSLLPKYTWVYYPIEDCYFGWDSSDWGNYHKTLHVLESGDTLFTLCHTSEYP